MRHFTTKTEAEDFLKTLPIHSDYKVFKKVRGQKNRVKKPFVVCSNIGWLNLN